jgi:hypothetical protein
MNRRATFDAFQRGDQNSQNANNSSSNNTSSYYLYTYNQNVVIYRLSLWRTPTLSEVTATPAAAAARAQPVAKRSKCPIPSLKYIMVYVSAALSTAAVMYHLIS